MEIKKRISYLIIMILFFIFYNILMMKIMVKDELILKLKNLNNISQIIKKYEKIDKDILKK